MAVCRLHGRLRHGAGGAGLFKYNKGEPLLDVRPRLGAAVAVLRRLAMVLYTMYGWWRDVVKESRSGYHTKVVSLHLRYGMILFIASEVMFFVAWSGRSSISRSIPARLNSPCVPSSPAATSRPRASRRLIRGTFRCSTR